MKKSLWILAAVLLVMLTCAGFYFIHDDAAPGVTRANFDRIEDGMTYAEVKAIFGCEPAIVLGSMEWQEDDNGEPGDQTNTIWIGSGDAFINFDQRGRVMSRGWRPWYRLKLEELRRWLFPI